VSPVAKRDCPGEGTANRKLVESTPFGPVALLWSDLPGGPAVFRVLLPRPGASAAAQALRFYPDARRASCAAIDALAERIEAFLAGEPVAFSLDLAALGTRPPFQQAVLRAEHAIPRGRVSTYGLIAARLGRPKASRAVGQALAANPFPLIVPCHRAVRSDGGLGGFQGGPAMKRALLEREGVVFDPAGRVIAPRFHYSR
jgi:methylated-DNA-[protein]-cysteine S-methyltransferase